VLAVLARRVALVRGNPGHSGTNSAQPGVLRDKHDTERGKPAAGRRGLSPE